MTKKKDSKKKQQKAAAKSTGKKTLKKAAAAKPVKKSTSKKPVKSSKPQTPKRVVSKPQPAKKSATPKKVVHKTGADKKAGKVKPEKTKVVQQKKPAQPVVVEAKPKGSPTKLSMALEDLETKPTVVKPRITRSKSGNLLFQLEYTIRSSPGILYEFLTTPSGLAQWFADKVDITDHHCIFDWEGFEETATIIDSIPDQYIRYRWDNSDEDEYFEFRISKNEITSDTILTITDFAPESAMKDQKMLWDSQVKTLMQQIGS